jgi:PIN domain-containing protein
VVTALRGAGEQVHTLAEVFGEQASQQLEDQSWIAHAGSRDWAALTKDKKIRHRTVEREAVDAHGVQLFALSNGNLGFAEMAGAFLAAMNTIHRICAASDSGGIWVVHRDGRVELLWPSETGTTDT